MNEDNSIQVLESVINDAMRNPGYFMESTDNIFTEADFSSISKFYTKMVNDIKSFALDVIDDAHDYETDKISENREKNDKSEIDKLIEKCVYYKSHHITRAEVHDYSGMRQGFDSTIRNLESISKNMINRTYSSVDAVEDAFSDFKDTIRSEDEDLKWKKENTKYLPIEKIEKILHASQSKSKTIKDQSDDLFHIITSFGKKSLELRKKNSDDPIVDRQIFVYNQCSTKLFKFMTKWIQFFATHADVDFV